MSTRGFQATFVDRIERHRRILLSVATAYCHDPEEREDLIQETIAQLWRSYRRFDDRTAFSTWMYRVAMNVAISFYRRETRKRQSFASEDQAALEQLPAREEPEADERLALLRELINRLAPLDRALMVLYLDDRPYAEIASILGISESNVATKVGRIKQRLRRDVAREPLQTGESDGIR